MMRQPDGAVFLKDVAEHRMTVLHADGLYRHLLFKKPKNSVHWFELVTWPGKLTISGDMGTWPFARVEDMFKFFRDDKLRINASYWAEKLEAGVHGGSRVAMRFDAELFRSELIEQLKNYDLSKADLKTVKAAIKEEIDDSNREYCYMAAREFRCELADGSDFEFDCSEMPDGEDYAYHFIWCLYAIVWGIQQWDKAQAEAAA